MAEARSGPRSLPEDTLNETRRSTAHPWSGAMDFGCHDLRFCHFATRVKFAEPRKSADREHLQLLIYRIT